MDTLTIMEAKQEIQDYTRELLRYHLWKELVDLVNEFDPHIVILIARKMPKICKVLELKFNNCVVISDSAILHCRHLINNAKVAIIDDLVNQGSTIEHVTNLVNKFNPQEVLQFAIAKRSKSSFKSSNIKLRCVVKEDLKKKEYESYTNPVPIALKFLPEPYDIEFPIFKTKLRENILNLYDITDAIDKLPNCHVNVIDTYPADKVGLYRVSVNFDSNKYLLQKIRLYIDFNERICNVVPVIYTPDISKVMLSSDVTRHLYNELFLDSKDFVLDDDDEENIIGKCIKAANLKTLLFLKGVELGQDFLNLFEESFIWKKNLLPSFSLDEAYVVFGSSISNAIGSIKGSLSDYNSYEKLILEQPISNANIDKSPFYFNLIESYFLPLLREIFVNSPYITKHKLLVMFFQLLEKSVGASDVNEYCLNWPYTKETILKNNYLRLKIGPTFGDICNMFYEFYPKENYIILRNTLSKLIDTLNDTGVIVPTIAVYEDIYYRVYRKGESTDETIQTSDNTFDIIEKLILKENKISKTRFAKVLSILSFSDKFPHIKPHSKERGVVGSITDSLDEEVDAIALLFYEKRIDRDKDNNLIIVNKS